MEEPKFQFGEHLVWTNGVQGWVTAERVDARVQFVMRSLGRFQHGDWGDLDESDCQSNEEALVEGYRLLGAYDVPSGHSGGPGVGDTRVWIITEADRSSTTVLWPSEY